MKRPAGTDKQTAVAPPSPRPGMPAFSASLDERARSLARRLDPARSRAPAGTVLVALAIAANLPGLQAGFFLDDLFYVVNNPTLRTVDGLRQMWLEPRSIPQYYPLLHTILWIEYHLFGDQPLGYHVVNLVAQCGCVLLVWRLLSQLRVSGAWLAAALFAVHPVEVETVVWVHELKNIVSLALAVMAMMCYLRFAPATDEPRPQPRCRWRCYCSALALFTLALLTKSVVASLPAVLLVIDWWKRGRITWRDVQPLLPFFAMGAVLGVYTAWLEKVHVKAQVELAMIDRPLIAGRALWFYAAKLAWPANLTCFYPKWNIDPRQWWQYLFPIGFGALLGILVLAQGKIGRGPLAAVLIFAGVLAPALGFLDVYPFRHAYVADHFQYHASLALLALAAAGGTLALSRASPPRRAVGALAVAAVLVALAAISFRQSDIYRDQESIYRDALAKNPDSVISHRNLAGLLADRGQFDEAVTLARRAAQLQPQTAVLHSLLGTYLLNRGEVRGLDRRELNEALGEYEIAIRLDPDDQRAYKGYGLALLRADRPSEAIKAYQHLLQRSPNSPELLVSLGAALESSGQTEEARRRFERAAQLAPRDPKPHHALGLLAYRRGRLDLAVAQLQTAVDLDPSLADAHYTLGLALQQQGHLRQAINHLRETVRLRPGSGEALGDLGVALVELGELDEAIAQFQTALTLRPDDAATRARLAAALEQRRAALDK